MAINSINKKSSSFTIDPGASIDSFTQYSINGTPEFIIGVDDTDDSFRISQGSSLGTTDTFKIDSDGLIIKPLNPCCGEQAANQINITGDATNHIITFTSSEFFDQGGNFSSPYLTAPITGRYLLTASVTLSGYNSGHTQNQYRLNTSNRYYTQFCRAYSAINPSTQYSFSGSMIADLDVGDTAWCSIYVSDGTKIVDVVGAYTYFSGCLIC